MAFADGYPGSSALFGRLVAEGPDADLSIIVTIPAFDEPDATTTLDSLLACDEPPGKVEVIVGVNNPPNASPEQLLGSEKTLSSLREWKSRKNNLWYRLHIVDLGSPSYTKWGVGMARKTLMDEAAQRFSLLDRNEGVIACLDADCRVSPNYFVSLYEKLGSDPGYIASVFYFEHNIDEIDSPVIKDAILQYELHLRYYYQGMKNAGFPAVLHTVGSTIAVKAEPYIKSGGMNRRQGGEDFYFIQKLIPAGNIRYITTATVYPSARISTRVPFGTGPAIKELLESRAGEYMTYNPEAFEPPRILNAGIDSLYRTGSMATTVIDSIPEPLRSYLVDCGLIERLEEVRANTSSPDSFRKRFLGWFNMFMMIKYLNWSHNENRFIRIPVEKAANEMLKKTGLGVPARGLSELLYQYRRLEK